jgi:hypothetical protein
MVREVASLTEKIGTLSATIAIEVTNLEVEAKQLWVEVEGLYKLVRSLGQLFPPPAFRPQNRVEILPDSTTVRPLTEGRLAQNSHNSAMVEKRRLKKA